MDETPLQADPGPAAPAGRAARRLPLALQALLLLAVPVALQLWQPVPWDADSAYHVAVARLLRAHGILQAFPWTSFSWLADRYADKELGFHLLLAPLAGLDWIAAARIAGAASGAALLWAMWLVLRREKVALAWLWPLVAVAGSGYFAMRFALVRPHVLGAAAALVGAWAAARRRCLAAFLSAAVFPWLHVAWHVALGLALLAEGARWLAGERPGWRAPAAVAAGLALGVAVHPNALALLSLWKVVNLGVLVDTAWRGREGFDLGTEFLRFTPAELLAHGALPLGAAAAALVLGWRGRRQDPLPLALALGAAAFAVLTLASQRFVEWLAPLAWTALALSLRGRGSPRFPAALAGGLAALAVLWTAALGLAPLAEMRRRLLDVAPATEAAWRAAVPEGAQVFTCGWVTTGELMLALPERRFLVALDPVLFQRRHPEAYARWYAWVRRPPPLPAPAITAAFGAAYVLCERALPEYWPLLDALDRDPGARMVAVDDLWVLYRLDAP